MILLNFIILLIFYDTISFKNYLSMGRYNQASIFIKATILFVVQLMNHNKNIHKK